MSCSWYSTSAGLSSSLNNASLQISLASGPGMGEIARWWTILDKTRVQSSQAWGQENLKNENEYSILGAYFTRSSKTQLYPNFTLNLTTRVHLCIGSRADILEVWVFSNYLNLKKSSIEQRTPQKTRQWLIRPTFNLFGRPRFASLLLTNACSQITLHF